MTQNGIGGNSATDDDIASPLDCDAGRSFTGNEDILRIERELVAEGVDLPKRHIPQWVRDLETDAEMDDAIEDELEAAHPNKSLIGYLNERKAEVEK